MVESGRVPARALAVVRHAESPDTSARRTLASWATATARAAGGVRRVTRLG